MKIILSILIFIMIAGSVFICVEQPKMHTRIMVYDSQYVVVENDKNTVEENIATEELPTMAVDNTVKETETFFTEEATPKENTKQEVKVKKVQPSVTVSKQANKNEIKQNVVPTKAVVNTKPQTVTTPKTVTSSQVKQEENNKKTVSTDVQKPVPKQTQKVLTAQEEEIAWNIWRSNLQNQIMKDTHLPVIPLGTIFKVSFDVDKSGRISNVQTWSTNPKYTPYAIEHIAPVIRNYQGKSILDFPQGSQRIKTTFTGGWRISQNSKYSTPANYNDVEKVTK